MILQRQTLFWYVSSTMLRFVDSVAFRLECRFADCNVSRDVYASMYSMCAVMTVEARISKRGQISDSKLEIRVRVIRSSLVFL